MASFLKSFRRSDEFETEQVRDLIAELEKKRVALESLVGRAESSAGQLRDFTSDDRLASIQGAAERIGSLDQQLTDFRERFNRARHEHEEMLRHQSQAAIRLTQFDGECEAAFRGLGDARGGVDELARTLEDLRGIAGTAADVRHQVETLKALSDQVMQRTAGLEQQRDAIDRAMKRVDAFEGMMSKLDAEMRRHEAQARTLTALQDKIDDITAQYDRVVQRSDEIQVRQKQIDEQETAAAHRLDSLLDQVKQSGERFEFESRGLDSATRRIADLRVALSECERQLTSVDEAQHALSDIASQAESLRAQLDGTREDLGRLQEQGVAARAIRTDVDRLNTVVNDVTRKVDLIEEKRSAIDAALEGFHALNRSTEAVRDGLEQVNVANAEMLRVQEGQAATHKWLAETERAVAALREQVNRLNEARPTVDLTVQQVNRLLASIDSLETRGVQLTDMHDRLSDLTNHAAQLDERSKSIEVRIETAEGRFGQLVLQSEDAERVAKQIFTVSRSVQEADKKAEAVKELVAGLEQRADNLERLSAQVRKLGEELDQRQSALNVASEHLSRASELRQETAEAVQRLEDESTRLNNTVSSIERRAEEMNTVSDNLADRANNLRFVEKRLTEFEERLSEWEQVEDSVARALDQVAARKETVDALRGELHQMFEMAERTVADVRSVTEARREIEDTRASVEGVLKQLRNADSMAKALDGRRRQIEQAETRVARVEALMIDIQSSLETLQAQKALVDHVIEKSGTLSFQTRQAEALIDSLREEREVTNRVRRAFADLRDNGETEVARAG